MPPNEARLTPNFPHCKSCANFQTQNPYTDHFGLSVSVPLGSPQGPARSRGAPPAEQATYANTSSGSFALIVFSFCLRALRQVGGGGF